MPKLQTSPPTTKSFVENVKRANCQACIWRSAIDPDPPNMDPIMHRWSKYCTSGCSSQQPTLVLNLQSPHICLAVDMPQLFVRTTKCNFWLRLLIGTPFMHNILLMQTSTALSKSMDKRHRRTTL